MSKFIFFSDTKFYLFCSIISRTDDGDITFFAVFNRRNLVWVGEFSVEGIVESFYDIFFGRDMEKIYSLCYSHTFSFGIHSHLYFVVVCESSKDCFDIFLYIYLCIFV